MENRITCLFNIKYPVVQAGMVWCSGWKLAAAVSNHGGLGLIGSGSMEPELLREHIRQCREATDAPFGVNLPLLYSHSEDHARVIREEGVEIVFTSAGNPKAWTSWFKEAGITVVHVVPNTKFARKAEEAGCDAIVGEGFEAGGHNGREETTTFCLIPLLLEAVSIPVIAAGGIGSGRSMLGAMALGAEGVQVGSRFAVSEESSAHAAFKQYVTEASEGDTVLTLKQLTPVRMMRNRFFYDVDAAEKRGAGQDELKTLLGRGRSRRGIFEGDLEEGELEIGEVSAQIREVLPAGAILNNIIEEYRALKENFCGT